MVLTGPTTNRVAHNAIPMHGRQFGQLTVLRRSMTCRKPLRWLCVCSCGREVMVIGSKLRSGHTKSCGCLRAAVSRAKELRHGLSGSRTHNIWQAMRRRCSRADQPNYKWYGGRGIKVCERWQSFDSFLADMGECPDGHELDRIDTNGNYEPGNCRWVTHKDNCAQGRRNYGSQR